MVGPGGFPEEPPRNSGGSGRCPADNHESGLPRIMVTQGVPEGYGGVARLLEGLREVTPMGFMAGPRLRKILDPHVPDPPVQGPDSRPSQTLS